MAEAQTLKQTLELTVPVADVESETEKAVESLKKRVRIPGFRPGKVPAELIRRRFQDDIRHEVLDKLLPKHFYKRAEEEGLAVVGTPSITEVHFNPGEPLRFKAEFEVAPQFELKEYKGIEVKYSEPEVSEEDIDKRLEAIRDQRAEFVAIDPRPAQDGDYAVVALKSTAGVNPPIEQDEVTLLIGGEETVQGFTENLRGMSPGEEKEFDVTYPEDYGNEKIAGKTVRFRATLKTLRKKELPELNDEFAADVGDFKNLEELRQAVRTSIFQERQFEAQSAAKSSIVDKLVEMHEFPVPEAYIESQIENQVRSHLGQLAMQGVDPSKIKLDWAKIKSSQRDRAIKDVKASLLIHRIADAEQIHATSDEVDKEVARIARQDREPVAAVRIRLEKEGGLGRIAQRIRTEKTLNFLFEHARKVAQ